MNFNDYISTLKFRWTLTEKDITLANFKRKGFHYDPEFGALERHITHTLISPSYNRVWGFDCSHWNGKVNMQTAAANGAIFCWIKAADGSVQTNYFADNYPAAKQAGIKRGPYFWLYPNWAVPIVAQVNKWWEIITKYGLPELPPVIDFEWTYYGGKQANPSPADLEMAINLFLQVSGGLMPIVYTSIGYTGTVGNIPAHVVAKTRGVWAAHYGVTNPLVPKEYPTWKFHQASDQLLGTIVGYDTNISKAADLNYYNGTYTEFLAFLGEENPNPEPEPEPPGTITYLNDVVRVNGREFNTDYEIITIPSHEIKDVKMIADGSNHTVDEIPGQLVFNFTPSEIGASVANMGVRNNGETIVDYKPYNPYIGWKLGQAFVDHRKTYWEEFPTASQGYRYIIHDGVKGATSSAWDNREPRRLIGRFPDGRTCLISTKGRAADQTGWTLHEAAEFGNKLGLEDLIDGDSGKSTNSLLRLENGEQIRFSGTGQNEPVPVICSIDFINPLIDPDTPPPPTAELWAGRVIIDGMIPIFQDHFFTVPLSPELPFIEYEGTLTGELYEDGDTVLWLETDFGAVPVRQYKDGVQVFKHMSLEKVVDPPPPPPPEEELAKDIPVQEVEVTVQADTIIWSDPNSNYGTLVKNLQFGEKIKVYDYTVPDQVGFEDNIKWRPVVSGGWVDDNKISDVPEARNIIGWSNSEEGRKVTFDDATYLIAPARDEFFTTYSYGKWGRLLWDWEWNGKPRVAYGNSAPHTVPLTQKDEFFPFNTKWQNFIHDLWHEWSYRVMTEGQRKRIWAAGTTERLWWNDQNGIRHQRRDDILGLYPEGLWISFKGLGMAGNAHKRKWGNVFETLNPDEDPPTVEWVLTEGRHLMGLCAVVTGDKHSIKFPHLKPFGCPDDGGYAMPYVLLGHGGWNTIDYNRYENIGTNTRVDIFC